LDETVPTSRPNLLRNMLVNVGGRGLLTLLALAVTPVLVRRLGTETYGVYVLAFTLGGTLAILDLGLTPAVVMLLSKAWHENDRPRMERIIGTALTTYLVAGAILSLGVALLVPWLTVSVLQVSPNLRPVAQAALWLSTGGFLLSLLFSVFNAIPIALERFDLTVLRTVGVSLLTTAAVIAYALAGGGLVGVMLINVVGNAVALGLFIVVSRHLLPGMSMRPLFDRTIFKAIARFSGFKLAGSVSGLVVYRFDQVAIGAMLGVRAAGVYVVPATAAARILALLTDLVLPLFPRISKLATDPAAVRSLLFRSVRLMALVASPTFITLFVFADSVIQAWIGGEPGRILAMEGATTLRWLAAASLLQAIAVVPIIISEAAGKPEINNGFAVASAIVTIPLVLILVPRLGIEGAAMAFFITSSTLLVAFVLYASRRFAQVGPLELVSESLLRPLVAAGLAGAVGVLIHPFVTGLPSLVVAVLLVLSLYVLAVRLVSALTPDDMGYLAPFVRRLPGPLNRILSARVR
jgi:O-antigen/teichoic acid export membrane protein